MTTPGQLKRRGQLYQQLAAMIAAGTPLIQALEMAGRNRSLAGSRRMILALIAGLKEGRTFTDSMRQVSGWMPEFDVALLSAGEASGRLDNSFKLLGRYYDKRATIIRDTAGRLMITFVTLHVFLVIAPLFLLVNFVLGIVNGQYLLCLAFIIEKIIVFGLLYGFIFLSVFSTEGNRGEGWRSFMEGIYSLVPVLRTAVKYLALARMSSALNALLDAGVDTVKSWELAAAASGSPHLKREILRWTPQLKHGTTPADMVSQIRYFPEMFTNLYHSAELSGKHDETLERLHIYFEDEGFSKLQTFAMILNFTIYFTIALIIAIFVIQTYVGYFNNLLNSV
jgi:type IV pilus assembly protein PilC